MISFVKLMLPLIKFMSLTSFCILAGTFELESPPLESDLLCAGFYYEEDALAWVFFWEPPWPACTLP